MTNRNRLQQLKDELTLWLLLYKLKQAGFETERLKLQKLMYLVNVFGGIEDLKPTSYTFVVYKHGPYTKDIQSDVEHLAANGLVHIKEVEKWKQWDPNHERSFKYKIVRGNIDEAIRLLSMVDLQKNEQIINFVVHVAGYLSSNSIRLLVYAEPNFIEAKKFSKQTKSFKAVPIEPNYQFIRRFKQLSRETYFAAYGSLPSEEQVSWFYLNFMRSLEESDYTNEISADDDSPCQ